MRLSERFKHPKFGGLKAGAWCAGAVRVYTGLTEAFLDLVEPRLKRSNVFEGLNLGRLEFTKKVV
jgi:hypothetical protein